MGKTKRGIANSTLSQRDVMDQLHRVKFTEVQRKKIADLCPDLGSRLKLDQKHLRVVELRHSELERVVERAQLALEDASGFDRQPLRKIVQTGKHIQSAPEGRQVYQLRIDLKDAKPPIWRRIQTEDCSLQDLHFHIQASMGWMNSHLYEIEVQGRRFSSAPPLDDGGFDEFDTEDATEVRLSQLLAESGGQLQLRYLYDFGDSWEHVIKLEDVLAAEPQKRYPICTDGRRACPPEDCGGIWGYYDFVAAIADPNHEEHEDMMEWNGPYDPEEFDPKTATKEMHQWTRW